MSQTGFQVSFGRTASGFGAIAYRLSELRAIVLRELDALADGDRSTIAVTLEEVERSLAGAIDDARQVELERDERARKRAA